MTTMIVVVKLVMVMINMLTMMMAMMMQIDAIAGVMSDAMCGPATP